jgi:hypothetical protein
MRIQEKNYDIDIHNKSSENMAKVEYFEMTLTNQHDLPREINSRLNSGNAFDRSIQKSSPFCLLSETLNIKMYNSVSFPSTDEKLKQQQPKSSPGVNSISARTFVGKITILIFAVHKM